MKKSIFLLLSAAGILSFAACSNNKGGKFTQAQLDSIAKVKADSIANANKLSNDSIINAKVDSTRMADSLAALKNGKESKKTVVVKKNKKSHTKPETSTPPAVVQQVKPRTQADIEADKKAAQFGDKAAMARLKADAAAKKAAQFGNQAAQKTVKQQEADKKASQFRR